MGCLLKFMQWSEPTSLDFNHLLVYRRWGCDLQVENLWPCLVAYFKRISQARGSQKSYTVSFAFEQSVCGHGRAHPNAVYLVCWYLDAPLNLAETAILRKYPPNAFSGSVVVVLWVH